METKKTNRRKIINDPVHGFISIRSDIVFDIIEHPYFQRLRRIRQLGLTNYVYPGATHSRFQHALGAVHLMNQAISVLQSKGHTITNEEAEAAEVAILLHDIGHGPFSHALEFSIIENCNHEMLSEWLMESLNEEFNGKLSLAIAIFRNQYQKKFLHQLVSGQLDMDRLYYLARDSFFTGVVEGIVGADRIIKMLDIVDDNLVVEAKGIYSIEKFLIARRLMYWQVYLHKTVLSAENLLVNILKRARYLSIQGKELFASPSFSYFLKRPAGKDAHIEKSEILSHFVLLDDSDILSAIKVWMNSDDVTLAMLCANMVNRRLYKIELQSKPIKKERLLALQQATKHKLSIPENELNYFVFANEISNNTYNLSDDRISVIFNNGTISDLSEVSEILDTAVVSKVVKRYFLCYPKNIGEIYQV